MRSPDHATSPDAERVKAGLAALEEKRARLDSDGPKSFDKPREAAQFYLEQRLAPGQTEIPIEHLRAELRKIEAREAAQRLKHGKALNPASPQNPGGIQGWQEVGPGNIGGRSRAIVIDPVNPDIMYAAGVAGGIWKSLNGGASWDVADDLMLNLAVCALAIDPTNPNILYAGTGEGFYSADVFVRGLGIFKSVDAGATWTQLAGTVTGVPTGAFYYVNKIVISPNNPNRIYAATRSGVWRSLDAGQTWSVVLSNPWEISTPPTSNGCYVGCTDLAVRSDANPDVLFAAFGSLVRDGLYRSEDGGDSWLAYTTASNQGRMTIAIAPSNNDFIYLLMADNGSGGGYGQLVDVFRSIDGGDSFEARVNMSSLTGPWLLSNLALATGCYPGGVYSQGWYDNIIAVDPLDPDTVWVGGIDIFRSDDGGQNFGIAGYWFFYLMSPPPAYQIHPDHHTIVFHPDYNGTTNQIMYVGNDGGLFRTTNALAATSQEDCPFPGEDPYPEIVWERLNNGYGVTQFYHGDSGRNDDVFVGGAQDNGTSRVLSRDTPDEWVMIFGGDGGYVAIDPADSQIMYIEYHGFPNIWKSVDGGDTFVQAVNGITDSDGVFITPFAMDPSDPDILWTGGSRPWRTTNGAASWEVAGANFAGPDRITAIAIAPSDHNIIYLGFNNGYIAKTFNGLDPLPIWAVYTNGLIGGWVSSVAVDPADPTIAYCTYSNYGIPHVLRTVNGGNSWTSIDGIGMSGVPDIPVHWIAVRPTNSQQLYVGTELGVFVSDDGGTTWEPGNNGLAHTVVESLDFKDDNTLVAFSHGRGAYITALEVENSEPALSAGEVTPTVGYYGTRFEFRVDYYDANGDAPSVIYVNIDGTAQNMTLDTGTAANGTYVKTTRDIAVGESHTFFFYAEDGEGGVSRMPESGALSGPLTFDPDLSLSGTPAQGAWMTVEVWGAVDALWGVAWSSEPGPFYLPASGLTYDIGPGDLHMAKRLGRDPLHLDQYGFGTADFRIGNQVSSGMKYIQGTTKMNAFWAKTNRETFVVP